MLLREEIEADLERMEFDFRVEADTDSQVFTWNGAEIPCCPSHESLETVIDIDGNPTVTNLRLIVRRSRFLTADSSLITVDSELFSVDNDTPTPVSGRTLNFRGRTYRILRARESTTQSFFVLDLANAGSNR